MNHAALLKEIARGHHGSRALSRADCGGLFAEVFAGTLPDAVLGALLVALRMKGETTDELLGLHDAWQQQHTPLRAPACAAHPTVVIGSYNGARRQPNLLPLFACLLARLGLPVLVHGVRPHATRVTSGEIFAALGIAPADSPENLASRLHGPSPVFVPLEVLSPPLARLLAWREVLGVRHLGHTLAKLINPLDGPALVLAGYTHLPYRELMEAYFTALGASALLLRGHEGEAVASAHRLPAPRLCRNRACVELAGYDETRGAAVCEVDADATAAFTRLALDNPALIPAPLLAQAATVLLACGLADDQTHAMHELQLRLEQGPDT